MKYLIPLLILVATAAQAKRVLPPIFPTPGPIIVPVRT